MIQQKKGALELSMNTIVIVVIGVTLLVLGLAFVTGIFDRLTGLSDNSFDEANQRLDQLGGSYDSFITLAPSNINIEKGSTKSKGVKAVISNLGSTSLDGLNVQLDVPQDSANDITCKFTDGTATKVVGSLTSGQNEELEIFVTAKSGVPLGTEACIVKVPNGPSNLDKESTFIVNIV
ncbi:hypothetical protein HYT57_01590 [Candidatus Woesearchaeota archaeon]|nr:hypothetical protein [Candidatus Woesearchaeota archaeon]